MEEKIITRPVVPKYDFPPVGCYVTEKYRYYLNFANDIWYRMHLFPKNGLRFFLLSRKTHFVKYVIWGEKVLQLTLSCYSKKLEKNTFDTFVPYDVAPFDNEN